MLSPFFDRNPSPARPTGQPVVFAALSLRRWWMVDFVGFFYCGEVAEIRMLS